MHLNGYSPLGAIICRDNQGTQECVNTAYGGFDTLLPKPTGTLPCDPTDGELERYGGRAIWNSLDARTKFNIGMAICSRRPAYGSVLTLASRLGWSACLTEAELIYAAGQNNVVRDFVRLAYAGDFKAAAAGLCGKSTAQITAEAEKYLGYYGTPLDQGGRPVGSTYTPGTTTTTPPTIPATGGGTSAGQAPGSSATPGLSTFILIGVGLLILRGALK